MLIHCVSTCFCCSALGCDISTWPICSWASHAELFDLFLDSLASVLGRENRQTSRPLLLQCCPCHGPRASSHFQSPPSQIYNSLITALPAHVAVPQLFPDVSTQLALLQSPAGPPLTPWFAANDPKSSSFHLHLSKFPHTEPRAEVLLYICWQASRAKNSIYSSDFLAASVLAQHRLFSNKD